VDKHNQQWKVMSQWDRQGYGTLIN